MKRRLSAVALVEEREDPLLKLAERSIYDLTNVFFSNPYLFYTESDLHCYLYKMLLEGLEEAGHGLYETLDKKATILLHKEYPTKEKYRKPLKDPTGKRGHFDLCIWNPKDVSKRLFRSKDSKEIALEQQTHIALELLLVEGAYESTLTEAIAHTKWDMLKLRENEVAYGYILMFARDWRFREDFLNGVKARKIPPNISLVYVESSFGQNVFEWLRK